MYSASSVFLRWESRFENFSLSFKKKKVLKLARTLKFYSLGKFLLHNTVLSAIVTTLYVRSSYFIHLITESLYPFTNITSRFSSTPAPSNHHSIVCFCEFNFFLDSTYISDNMQYLSFSLWFILLSTVPFSFIHVVVRLKNSYCIYVPHRYPFICGGHLGCF